MFLAAKGLGAALERTCRPGHERVGPTKWEGLVLSSAPPVTAAR